MENSTKRVETPLLIVNLLALLNAHRGLFKQERVYRRGVALVLAEVMAFGRHTVTQLLQVLGVTEGDWSSWYRVWSKPRVEEEALAQGLFAESLAHVAADELYVIGTDGTQIPRTSGRMPGVSWLKSPRTPVFYPGIHRAQRFVHGCWFTPLAKGFSRAIPLRFLPAFPQKAQAAPVAPCKEWEAGVAFVSWIRRQLDRVGRDAQQILYLADGSYETAALWNALPQGVTAALRTARNRAVYAYLPPSQRKGRRKYGLRLDTPATWFPQRKGTTACRLLVRGHIRELRYRIVGPVVCRGAADVPLYLLIVGGQTWYQGKQTRRRKHREPVAYLVNAQRLDKDTCRFPLTPELILAWLWQRWEMEVAHREMKSGLGVGEKQCWSPHAAILSVQWSVWVYSLLLLAAYRTWGLEPIPASRPRWSPQPRRWSFNALWRAYRQALWSTPDYRPLCTPIPHNWYDTELQIAGLWNAVTASVRS